MWGGGGVGMGMGGVNSILLFNPIVLRKAKIVCNFGLSECNRVNKRPFAA